MSGAGVMSAAMKTLRSNRALLRKNTGAFNIKEHNTFKGKPISAYKKYSFRKAKPVYMRALRRKLKADRVKTQVKTTTILVLSIALVLFILFA